MIRLELKRRNGLFGSRFDHFEQLRILNTNFEQIGRITRIKTDHQTILSLLVGSLGVQRRSPVTGYALYTSPRKRRGGHSAATI